MSHLLTLLSSARRPVMSQSFNLSGASLPGELTYSRTGAATCRDVSGILQQVAANVPRLGHDIDGNALGVLIEPPITNKMTDRNCNPTDTTGWIVTGSSGVLSVVDDPSGYLASRKLQGVCSSGKLYKLDNTGGTSTATLECTATFGNTNVHTISVNVVALNGFVQLNRAGANKAVAMNILPGPFQRYAMQVTPDQITDRCIQLLVPVGRVMYFIGAQVEETTYRLKDGTPVPTSLVVTNAAAASRGGDNLSLTDLPGKPYYKATEGSIVVEMMLSGYHATLDQVVVSLQEGTANNNRYGLAVNTDTNMRRVAIGGGVSQGVQPVHKPPTGRKYRAALSWKPGMTTNFSQVAFLDEPTLNEPVNIDRLLIGSTRFGTSHLFGHVSSVKLYNRYRSVEQLGPDIFEAGSTAIVCTGQSNIEGYFRSDAEKENEGEIAGLATYDGLVPGSCNYLIRAAFGASEAIREEPGNNWWFDQAAQTFGPRMEAYNKLAGALVNAGVSVKAIIWDQGESDATMSFADIRDAWDKIFTEFRKKLPVPIVQMPLGRRTDGANPQYQTLYDAKSWLEQNRAYIYRGPEKFPYEMANEVGYTVDNVHLSKAGYAMIAPRAIRKALKVGGVTVSGPVDGSTVTAASRSGSSVTVTLSHPIGITDFTPTTGIEGFSFEAGGTPIAITAAVRTNGTTITLTLASAPAGGAEVLYYGYGTVYPLNRANAVLGNGLNNLPLQRARITL